MGQGNGSTDVDVVAACAKILRELEQEIKTAMNAIACNRLTDIEESLWRQETLCARLKRCIPTIRPAMLNAEVSGVLREAASRLIAQSQIYETLVARASRSTAILQHLCSLYRTAAQHPGRAMYRTISREA
jgi:glutamate racemase